ncbi:hypothetical protein [uncultured Vibrio sp.]|uniref:hypothetical protein n=1 Tax=uncultured Vibrio sp. TaxID=114054 RepID=UPI0025CB9E1D|nr:hypothetical protein [uncultured Vibrio sp.]
MKKRIKRLSPHQNGKVFGVLMALVSLPMFLPMMVMMFFIPSGFEDSGSSGSFHFVTFVVFPIVYLIFGYIFVAVTCMIYNFIQRFTGGFEYETSELENT